MKHCCQGQASAEFALALPIFTSLVIWGYIYVQGALQERVQGQQMAQLALAHSDERHSYELALLDDADWNLRLQLWVNMSKWSVLYPRVDYPTAFALAPLELLSRYERGLDMGQVNLWDFEMAEFGHFEWLRYQSLRDDWSPRRQQQLEARPQRLSASNLLDNGVVRQIQNLVGATPVGRELRSNSLIFGHVDTDVVPFAAICSDPSRTRNCQP